MAESQVREGSAERESGTESRVGCGWYLLGLVLTGVGALAGTAWTARSWADCPLGVNVSNNIGLQMTMVTVWLAMTSLLLAAQLALAKWPLPGGRISRWLAPFAVAAALTLLYRLGMEWPEIPADGACTDAYPLFPFTGKT